MSKKHFERIASELRYNKPNKRKRSAYEQWRRDVVSMANVCASFNGTFDRMRFLHACDYDV